MPRRLGAWLAGRAGIPLDDRATAGYKQKEMAALIARMEAGGLLNRWAAKHLRRC